VSNARILIVEDDTTVAQHIQMELTSLGYDVPTVAASGQEAIEQAAASHPDLVLMDISLPGGMDGVATAERLHARADVPVVYLSAYADAKTLQRAKATEPFGYLLKPYADKELHTTIETALYKYRMERKLKETERWLAATLRCIKDAVIATDARGCIQFINPMAEALTGWKCEEALGEDLPAVFRTADGSAVAPFEASTLGAPHPNGGADPPDASLLLTRDGRRVPFEGSRAPILDDDGNFTGVVLAFRDVSERLHAEDTIRRIEEQLHEAQKMEAVGRLAGGVAHDFNQLLNSIYDNISRALLGMPRSDPNRDLIQATEKAVLRTAGLVKRLLEFAQRTVLRMEPMDLNPCVRKAVGILRQILDCRIALTFKPAADLWPVRADAGRITEVLMTLCLNARDAMPDGGQIVLETANVVIEEDYFREHLQAVPGEFVCLRVTDTGRGMAPEVRSRIFEPFFTTKESDHSAGLGLAVAFGIVEQHRGWIDCRSEVNQGTRFDIYLPRAAQPVAQDSNPDGPPCGSGCQS